MCYHKTGVDAALIRGRGQGSGAAHCNEIPPGTYNRRMPLPPGAGLAETILGLQPGYIVV